MIRRVEWRSAAKPTRMPEIENSRKKLDPNAPYCLGDSPSSRMIGTAAPPSRTRS
jgi:hypothetical protein